MLKACSFFVLIIAIFTIVFVPDPKTAIPTLMFRGGLKLFTLLEPETDPTGTSREWRGMERLFRAFKMDSGLDDINDPHLYDKMTENMNGFPILVPAKPEVKKTEIYIKNGEVNVHTFWCDPPNSRDDRVFLYFHGGGMHAGQAWQEFGCSDEFSIRSKARVLTVDYRLLPKHTAKEAVSDMIAAYKWLLDEKKYLPEHIVIAGCSGGGMSSILAGLQIVASGLPNPRRIVAGSPGLGFELLYPGVLEDPKKFRELPSMKEDILHDTDSMIDVDTDIAVAMIQNWIKNKDYTFPLFNNASGLPKTLFYAGGAEALASSVELGYEHFKKQGAPVTFEKIPYMGHCFGSFVNYPEGAKYMERQIEFAWGN